MYDYITSRTDEILAALNNITYDNCTLEEVQKIKALVDAVIVQYVAQSSASGGLRLSPNWNAYLCGTAVAFFNRERVTPSSVALMGLCAMKGIYGKGSSGGSRSSTSRTSSSTRTSSTSRSSGTYYAGRSVSTSGRSLLGPSGYAVTSRSSSGYWILGIYTYNGGSRTRTEIDDVCLAKNVVEFVQNQLNITSTALNDAINEFNSANVTDPYDIALNQTTNLQNVENAIIAIDEMFDASNAVIRLPNLFFLLFAYILYFFKDH
jgi:hypothetical protein